MKHGFSLFFAAVVAGCAQLPQKTDRPFEEAVEDIARPDPALIRPQARPATLNTTPRPAPPPPPKTARTVEQFDTTSAEERVEAVKAAAAEPVTRSDFLGKTVASLGDVTTPGIWLETPLVDTPMKGKVVYPANGKSVIVDLIPIDGQATAGSRISLAAMRLIEAPLTELPEIEVFKADADS